MDKASAIRVGRRHTNGARSEEEEELPPKFGEVRPMAVRVAAKNARKHQMHITHLIGVQRRP